MSYQHDISGSYDGVVDYRYNDTVHVSDYNQSATNVVLSPSVYSLTLPVPMDRGLGRSGSSSTSNVSGQSMSSIALSIQSPITETSSDGSPQGYSAYYGGELSISPYLLNTPSYATVPIPADQPYSDYLPSQYSPPLEPLPLVPDFDPREGDPGIGWELYYDFEVMTDGPVWMLQKGYIPSDEFPIQIPCKETYGSDDKRDFRCLNRDCKSSPFARLHDLSRHMNSVHSKSSPSPKKKSYCDYKQCPHKDSSFHRRDHFREHFREYHNEDLPKRKMSEAEFADFMAARIGKLRLDWFRCSKCLQKVKTKNGYTCKCGTPCEVGRQMARTAALQAA